LNLSGLARVERWYPVSGSTAEDVARAIARLGPARGPHRFGAYTDWTVTWRYRIEENAGVAHLAELDVFGEAAITLPRFLPLRATTDALRDRFARYLDALREHEQGHLRFAEEAVACVRDALAGLAEASTAAALEASITRAANDALDAVRNREAAYDETTGAGRTQGATWDRDGG
jgi:predicted secreted Zn-dependent protease